MDVPPEYIYGDNPVIFPNVRRGMDNNMMALKARGLASFINLNRRQPSIGRREPQPKGTSATTLGKKSKPAPKKAPKSVAKPAAKPAAKA